MCIVLVRSIDYLYTDILWSRADSLRPCLVWSRMSDFLYSVLNINRISTALFGCCMADATCNCCRFGARSVCTIQPCANLQCHFNQSHMRSVYVSNRTLTVSIVFYHKQSPRKQLFIHYCTYITTHPHQHPHTPKESHTYAPSNLPSPTQIRITISE